MRKHLKKLILLPLFAALPLWAAGFLPDPRSQSIRGEGGTFRVTPPWGWVLDRGMGKTVETDAVLYPKGTTYKDAPSVLYVTAAPSDGAPDLKSFLKRELKELKSENPKLKVEEGPVLATRLLKPSPVRFYSGFKDGHFEAVAYVSERGFTMVFVLSTSDEKVLQEDLPALQALAASYEALRGEQEEETGIG